MPLSEFDVYPCDLWEESDPQLTQMRTAFGGKLQVHTADLLHFAHRFSQMFSCS